MINTEYKFGEVHVLGDQVKPAFDRVQFQRIFETSNGGITLLALKEGQQLAEHVAPAELMVYVLEGSIQFNVNDNPNVLNGGDFILIGTDVKHSVEAKESSKVMLVKIKA